MSAVRIALCKAALTLFVAALARLPYTPPGSNDAVLRFSWRLSIQAKENCRPRTEEELAALPVHMRTPEVCTRDIADYTLITEVDDLPADTIQLARGGLKGDRPLFVLSERTLSPGLHHTRISLQRRTGSAIRILAELDTVLTMQPGQVQLVTLDAETGRLITRSSFRRIAPAHHSDDDDEDGKGYRKGDGDGDGDDKGKGRG